MSVAERTTDDERRTLPAPFPLRPYLAAVAIAAVAGVLSLVLMLMPAHAAADVTHYKYWTRLVTLDGVSGAYSGQYPETAAIYPPVTMYGYWLVGQLYQALVDPSFDLERALESRALTVLVKLVAVVPHLVAIVVICALLLGRYGAGVAVAAAAAYGLNPAALFDLAYWGQPDSVHALFLVLAIWSFEEDRPPLGWAFVGLAAATKPQAWALLPLLGYVSLRRFGLARTALGCLVAGAVALVVCLPYFLAGTFGQLLTLPRLIAETMPVVSANAHNLWWLVTDFRPGFVPDAEPIVGNLSYRTLALFLTVVLLAYTLWRTDPTVGGGGLFAPAAYLAFGWFIVTTRAHENHDFFVLPLLIMVAPRAGFLSAAFLVISTTLFLNMTLHDFSLAPFYDATLGVELWARLQYMNAGVNVALFVLWTRWLGTRSGARLSVPRNEGSARVRAQ